INRYAETLQVPPQNQDRSTTPGSTGPSPPQEISPVSSHPNQVRVETFQLLQPVSSTPSHPVHTGVETFQLLQPSSHTATSASSRPYHTGTNDFQLLHSPQSCEVSPPSSRPYHDRAENLQLVQPSTASSVPSHISQKRANAFQLLFPIHSQSHNDTSAVSH